MRGRKEDLNCFYVPIFPGPIPPNLDRRLRAKSKALIDFSRTPEVSLPAISKWPVDAIP